MKEFIGKLRKELNETLALKQLILAVTMTLFSEMLFRKSVIKLVAWVFSHPFLFILNVSEVLIILSIMGLIFRKYAIASGTVVVLGLSIAVVNAQKYALRNVPLTLDDIGLVREVWALRHTIITTNITGYVILGMLAVCGLGWLIYKYYQKVNLNKRDRTHISIVMICLMIFGIGQTVNVSSESMETTGFYYSLTNETRHKQVVDEAVEKDALEQMYSDIDNYTAPESIVETGSDEVQPNVIIIMSEAFWDVNKLGVDFSQNPIAFFDSLRDESLYGELYVPVIGGGTVNTEFEVMTGMTLKNYSNDFYMVYPNEIKSPFPALASIYRNQGYESVAVHPYMSWYYNRIEVYKNFGFNGFESLEAMGDTEKFGSYTKDSVTFDAVLELIKSTEKPLFNYTVTMQNHGPYGDLRFTEDEKYISVETPLSFDANYFLSNYVQGLAYSDEALESFIDSLRTLDEPTIVVFFGDHLPMLGEDYLTYRESGYIGDETNQEVLGNLDMMTVPFVVWRNDQATSKNLGIMNASFLTPKILNWSGAEVPDYLKAVEMMSERMPVFNYYYGISADGSQNDRDSYPLNLMFGEYEEINNHLSELNEESECLITENDEYYQYFSSVAITEIEVEEGITMISGYDFSPTMTLLVNNIPEAFDFIDDSTLRVEEQLASEDIVQVLLEDASGAQIDSSNMYKLP